MFDFYRVPDAPKSLELPPEPAAEDLLSAGVRAEAEIAFERETDGLPLILQRILEISSAATTDGVGESAGRYRARKSSNKKKVGRSSGRIKAEANYFIEKLVRLVPSEAVALYLFAQGLIGKDRPVTLIVWSLFCLFIAGLVRYIGTKDAMNKSVQLGAIFIACVSFIIWLYNIGGPFLLIPSLHDPVIASLMIAGWTTLTTLLYKP